MPNSTVAQAVVSSRLLTTSAPSREIGANRPPCFSSGARQANSASEPAMKKARMARMKTPRLGSLAKACTEVSTPERTRKVPSSENEKARMARKIVHTFSASRFSITADRMQERGAREPGHQRGVLDRVPEPEAAPAQRVIGPVGAHRDAERQEAPGDQREGPHEARPGRVDAALDQRRGGEGEHDREADIAEIEQRRMDREAGVLQDRVEIAALERRRRQPLERVRGQRG